MRHRFHVQFKAGVRALAGLGVILGIGVYLLARDGHEPAALALAGALGVTATVLLVLVWRRLAALHRHAQQHVQTAEEAECHYFSVLCEVVKALERRDRRLAGRSERIAQLVAQLAKRMDLPQRQGELLTMVATVHDIGLLSVPESVLNRPTGLGGAEYNIVKDHCLIGRKMLEPLTFLHPVLDAVLYHHERMNGTGYPEGRQGEQIPLEARLLAVADAFDAMTHDRPHRPALSARQAMAELIRCAGSGYDTVCVHALAVVTGTQDLLTSQPSDQAPAALAGCHQ